MAGGRQAFCIFIIETADDAGLGAKGLLPGGKKFVEAFLIRFKAGAQLRVDELFKKMGDTKTATAWATRGHRIGRTHRFWP
ncbi:MAG: Uncharacterised protein [Prochlorococcus marinus str. MIT 9215]|nr:MAG: Uncharacterised protein [Prochlorococcus marinus str. MIT 9215]